MDTQKTEVTKKYRQGDVILVKTEDGIPDGFVEVPRDKRGIVLAEGTASQHWHGITSHAAKLFRDDRGRRRLRIVEAVKLEQFTAKPNDQDGLHGPIAVDAGDYLVGIHSEHQPGELPRQVMD